MSTGFWIWSHVSFILLVVAAICPLLRRQSGVATQTLCCLAVVGLAVLPLKHLDISGLLLGHIGVLSASTMVLLLHSISCQLVQTRRPSKTERLAINAAGLLVGGVIYASTFGFVDADIYALGYTARMPWLVLAISGIAALSRHWLLAVCLVAAVVAQQWRLCESPNLWDCLIDPWLFFAAVFQLLQTVFHRRPLLETTVAHTEQTA